MLILNGLKSYLTYVLAVWAAHKIWWVVINVIDGNYDITRCLKKRNIDRQYCYSFLSPKAIISDSSYIGCVIDDPLGNTAH